jgi:hypothetical protein
MIIYIDLAAINIFFGCVTEKKPRIIAYKIVKFAFVQESLQ